VPPGYAQAIIIDGKGEVDFFNLLSDSMFHPDFANVRTGIEEIMPALRYIVQEEIPRRKSVVVETARRGDSAKPMSAVELYKKGVEDCAYPDICPLIVVVDEFAELMLDSKDNRREFEELVQRIAQLGRSSLVHLILATQRPDNKIVSGAIKANLSTRVALQLPSHHDSMTILGRKGAEDLLGKGDLLFETASVPITRLQGYVV
jgi:S-DNA-T family DNA segregation ATPase FtsK/SpoIIIE